MKIRPFAWVIIALNLYFIISFFSDYDVEADPTSNGLGIMVLIFWLAIMNTFLYVLFRITARSKKAKVPETLESKIKEINKLRQNGLITDDEYSVRRKKLIEGESGA